MFSGCSFRIKDAFVKTAAAVLLDLALHRIHRENRASQRPGPKERGRNPQMQRGKENGKAELEVFVSSNLKGKAGEVTLGKNLCSSTRRCGLNSRNEKLPNNEEVKRLRRG